jgi:hypothetical protein
MTTRSGERSGRRPVYRVAGGPYGLGLLFGFLAALNGQLDLTASWLIAAYVLVGILIVFNLWFERWTRRVEDAVGDKSGPPPNCLRRSGLGFRSTRSLG